MASPVKIAKIGKADANQANCIGFEANISLDPIMKNQKNRIKNQPWSFFVQSFMSRYLPNIILVATIIGLFITVKPATRPEQSALIGQWSAQIDDKLVAEFVPDIFKNDLFNNSLAKLSASLLKSQVIADFDERGNIHFHLNPPKMLDNLINDVSDSKNIPDAGSFWTHWQGNWRTTDSSSQPEKIVIERGGRSFIIDITWIDENTIQMVPPQLENVGKPLTFKRSLEQKIRNIRR